MGHRVEARIVTAINMNEGSIAKVKGQIYYEGKKVIKVVELYHGRFVNCKTPFHSHQLMLHRLRLSLDLPLILMVLGPALPPVDMWRMLAQGATQTVSLGKFCCLYYSGLLMASSFSHNVDFMGTILPGDELTAKLRHTGNIVVSVETSNSREKVLQGTAEVAQPSTFYVFMGQGSEECSMGMLLRALLGKAQMPI